MTLQEMLQQRARLVANMRTMLDGGLKTPEDEATYDRYEKEESQLEKDIQRAEKLAATEKVLNEVRETPVVETPQPETRAEAKAQDEQKRYTEAFERFLRKPMSELDAQTRAVLNTGTGSEGGYVVPVEYFRTVIERLSQINVMRQYITVLPTESTTQLPLDASDPTFAEVAENGAYGDTDVSFGQKTLNAYKLGGIIKTSDELMMDAFINLEQYLTGKIATGLSDVEDARIATGTGSGQGEGITVGGTQGKLTASGTTVTIDEMLDLEYSLKAAYRNRGTFLMNSSTELVLRKIKDNDGQYLWQPAVTLGAPNTFDGKPVVINESMPDLGLNNKFAAFGDLSYFVMADRGNMEIKRLNELYAANGQTGWRVSKRYDCKVTQSEAIKYAQNAAV